MFKRIAILVGIVAVAAPICIFLMFQVMARCEDYGWRLADRGERLSAQARSRENTELAMQNYQWAAIMFRLSYSRGMRCQILTRIGNIWRQRGNNSKAAECFEESYRLAKALGWPAGQSQALKHLASLYYDQKQYPAAVKASEECASLSKQAGDKQLEQYALHCAAIACDRSGLTAEAMEYYAKALEIAEKRNKIKAQMQMLGPLAYLYFTNGDYAKAAAMCLKGIKLADSRGDSQWEVDEKSIRENLDEILREWDKKDPESDGLKQVRAALERSTKSQELIFSAIERADIDATKELLAAGAKVNVLGKKGETPLELAARAGSLEIVKLLVANGASLKMHHSFYRTAGEAALSETLAHCREDIARYLLASGVQIGEGFRQDTSIVENAAKCSPTLCKLVLDEAIKSRQESHSTVTVTALAAAARAGNVETVRFLLDRGVNVNATDRYLGPALVEAASREDMRHADREISRDNAQLSVVTLLLERGADPNAPGWGMRTALMSASTEGKVKIAQLLLEKGADVNAKSQDGKTAFSCAVEKGHVEIVRLLADHGAHVNAKTGKGITTLKLAVDRGQTDLVRFLLDKGADANATLEDGSTPLMWAIIPDRKDMVKLLLDRGARVNAQTSDGGTALTWAALMERTELAALLKAHGAEETLQAAVILRDADGVRRLLAHGADVNSRHADGGTALVDAAGRGHADIVSLLLEAGADVNAKRADGSTPLVAAMADGSIDLITLLLDKGADLKAEDAGGQTPLAEAIKYGRIDLAALMLDRGADANHKNRQGQTPLVTAARSGRTEVVKLLLDRGADFSKGPSRAQALCAAVNSGKIDTVKLLLEKGADVNEAIDHGITPLISAVGHGDIVKLLLEKGADVNAKTEFHRNTALNYAIWQGDLESVRLLLDHGAGVNHKDSQALTPLKHAEEKSLHEIAKLLRERGAEE